MIRHFQITIPFLLLFVSFQIFSQEKLFLDENMTQIDWLQYSKKCKSHIYKCLEYKTDSVSINKILYKYAFGKISPIEYRQLKNLLAKDSRTKIDSNATLVIKYTDSLLNYQSAYRNQIKHNKSHKLAVQTADNKVKMVSIHHDKYNLKKYKKDRKKWAKTQNKCIKKFENIEHIKVAHVYKHSEDSETSYPEFNWVKDRGVFKNNFF